MFMSARSLVPFGVAIMLVVAASSANATVYQVATSGSDDADGSDATPWATIQHCAAIAQPGDTCQVHSGTYRETVTPPRSGSDGAHIRFEAAPGECVTVSGADVFSGSWTQDGAIWSTSTSSQFIQLFSSGKMLQEARWPNADPDDLLHAPYAIADVGTDTSGLVASDAPPGDWTGAIIWVLPGDRWVSYTRRVASYDTVTKRITFDSPIDELAPIYPNPGSHYALFGANLALDTAGEWFLDTNSGTLYLSPPGAADPQTLSLEIKQRDSAFVVSNLSYIDIVGFQIFAAAIQIDHSNNCTVDNIKQQYPTQLRTTYGLNTPTTLMQGMVGDDNVWKNSVVEQSASAGVYVIGQRNTIVNNIFHDIDYLCTNEGAIFFPSNTPTSNDALVAYNTITRTGRDGISLYGAGAARVLFNNISFISLFSEDSGGIYTAQVDGQNTEIAWNEVSQSHALFGRGIYIDDEALNYVVHDNYIHDVPYGASLKEHDAIFNNTIANASISPLDMDIDAKSNQWNVVGALFMNNVRDGTTAMELDVRPSAVADYGDYRIPFLATADWQHVTIPFATLRQPTWAVFEPFDLTAVTDLSISQITYGDYIVDIDNVQLEGVTPQLLSDFDDGQLSSELGVGWGCYAGGGSSEQFALTTPGAACSAGALRVQGTSDVAGYMGCNLGGFQTAVDFSNYTGISFDIRAKTRFAMAATGVTPPTQGLDYSCPLDGGVPMNGCGVGSAQAISPYNDGALDLGAFPAGQPTWTSGAQFVENSGLCTGVTDAVMNLPAAAAYPVTPSGTWPAQSFDANFATLCTLPDAGVQGDAGVQPNIDAGTQPGGVDGGFNTYDGNGGGCGCRAVDLGGSASRGLLLLAALGGVAARRRRARR